MNTDNILVVHNLKKTFHGKNGSEVQAVRGISFSVRRGEIFGFLGPNGAGKSTTITMLTTGLKPDEGEILLDGISVTDHPTEARARIGVVAQHNNLDRQGTTIFLTTHYMEEPERFCKDIAIVSSGELKAMGTKEELKSMIPPRADGRETTLDDVFVSLTAAILIMGYAGFRRFHRMVVGER